MISPKRWYIALKSTVWRRSLDSWLSVLLVIVFIFFLWGYDDEEDTRQKALQAPSNILKMNPVFRANVRKPRRQAHRPSRRRPSKGRKVRGSEKKSIPDTGKEDKKPPENSIPKKSKESQRRKRLMRRRRARSGGHSKRNQTMPLNKLPLKHTKLAKTETTRVEINNTIHIVMIACQPKQKSKFDIQIDLFNVLLKSVLLLSPSKFDVIVVVDEDQTFQKLFFSTKTWISAYAKRIKLSQRLIWYPSLERKRQFHKICHLCAMARLFLPQVLSDLEKVIYVDTDFLFLQPIEQLWKEFDHFNSSTIMAVAQYTTKYYEKNAKRHKLPHAPDGFYNAGVQLLHLGNMRKLSPSWEETMLRIYDEFGGKKGKLKTCDQDIINVFIGGFPSTYKVLPCNWNFRSFTCPRKQCDVLWTSGVGAIHGVLQWFSNNSTTAHQFWDVFKRFPDPPELHKQLEAAASKFEKDEMETCKKSKRYVFGKLFSPFITSVKKGLELN